MFEPTIEEQEQEEKLSILAIHRAIRREIIDYINESLLILYGERRVTDGEDAAVSANDARRIYEEEVLPELPPEMVPSSNNFLGAVWSAKQWELVGHVPSKIKGSHAHRVFTWVPRSDEETDSNAVLDTLTV